MHTPQVRGGRDAAAMATHHRINAINTHSALAERTWIALRWLGVEQGRMLVRGIDAPVFTGAPLGYTRVRDQSYSELVAQIPAPNWPHESLVPHPHTDQDPVGYDVVITNAPYSDVRFTNPSNRAWLLDLHENLIHHSLASTLPGGIAAVITTHRVLDTDSHQARARMLESADLIGAVRLPSASLRDTDYTDQTDQVVDLLLFRRRGPGEPVRSADFVQAVPIELDGQTLLGNKYWREHPDHVIGRPGAYPEEDGRTELWVRHEGEPLYDRLASVLGRVVDSAEARGLRATSRSWALPGQWPATGGRRAEQASRSVDEMQRTTPAAAPPVPPRTSPGPGPDL